MIRVEREVESQSESEGIELEKEGREGRKERRGLGAKFSAINATMHFALFSPSISSHAITSRTNLCNL